MLNKYRKIEPYQTEEEMCALKTTIQDPESFI